MRRDISRTLVVIAEHPQLWAAIRDRLDPALALVRNSRPAQLVEVWPRADPWPWLVVGAAEEVPERLAELVADRPIPVLWLRQPRGSLPPGSVVHPSWNRLAGELDALSTTPVFGMRFAPRRGVQADGSCLLAPELEGLMAAHPRGLPAFDGVQRVQRLVERHALPCRVEVVGESARLRARAPSPLEGEGRGGGDGSRRAFGRPSEQPPHPALPLQGGGNRKARPLQGGGNRKARPLRGGGNR